MLPLEPAILTDDLLEQHFTNPFYYPTTVTETTTAEAIESLQPSTSDGFGGAYLFPGSPIEVVDLNAFSPALPEIDKDTLAAALGELDNFSPTQQSGSGATGSTCFGDYPHGTVGDLPCPMEEEEEEEDDARSPVDTPRIHNFFSSHSLEDLVNRPEYEDIFREESVLMEQLSKIVDVSSLPHLVFALIKPALVTLSLFLFSRVDRVPMQLTGRGREGGRESSRKRRRRSRKRSA